MTRADAKKWAFLLVPAAGLLELSLHVVQTTSGVVPDADWKAARDLVKQKVKDTDLVLFAPTWSDPVGREHFKDEIASVEREAAPDVTRFARALEVSIRGAHRRELDGWREIGRERAGKVTVVTWENPSPPTLKDDLVVQTKPQALRVFRVDGAGESECVFGQNAVQTGGLGFGPAIPSARWTCKGGGFVGVTVLPALDYSARRCIFAPPFGGSSVLRLVFTGIRFGRGLHGHHGLYAEAERNKNGPAVTLTFRANETTIGKVVHADGDGWKGFELDTSDLEGKTGDLVAEVTAQNGNRRQYCFEADTR